MSDQASGQGNGSSAQSGNNGSPQSSSPQYMAPDEMAEILPPGAKNFNKPNGGNAPRNSGNPIQNYEQMQTPQRATAQLSIAKMERRGYIQKRLDEQTG